MSVSISIKGFSGKDSKEFQKHFKAVQFCIENELSYPKETSEFFKGRLEGSDLEDINLDYVIEYIQNGIEIDLPLTGSEFERHIKISEIPKEVDEIIIKLS